MDEISNKTLATLLVVAIVISLAGTFAALRGANEVTSIITGAQTTADHYGTAKVNITEAAGITVRQSVDFGAGYRNVTVVDANTECNLTSGLAKPDCWIAESAYDPLDFTVENTGNIFVNVTINGTTSNQFFPTKCDSGTIIGGTHGYWWAGEVGSEGGLRNGCTVGSDLVTAQTAFTDAHQLICANLTPDDGTDQFNVTIKLAVPSGPSGICEDTVTFTATKNY